MGKILNYFGLNRLFKLSDIVRRNNGIRGTYLQLFRRDCLKLGTLVGIDKYGNKYFQNPYYFYGSNRWVEYADHVNLNYNATQIPAEWHGWMHYKTDIPPNRDGTRKQYKWMSAHSENLSGTKDAYMPYSTTRSKIQLWDPNSKKDN